MDGKALREGIFALHTRRFGSVAEFMVKRILRCGRAKSLFHDLYDDAARHRIEVKFSRVQKQSETAISEATVLQCIEEAISANRVVTFTGWKSCIFDCNIQQIKRTEFDILYYGLFFADCVKIFRITSGEIGPDIYYSDKQHKGNEGEGQFHINQDTLNIHLAKYHYKTLTYEELYELLRG
jgi:hypothetical protein